ncbi:amidase/aspartyl-tRNA(Asn)/glutamyl-tRNA(Gln) amidotransferase subunit A [Motilibacter peucedani]|uniref:Amidase/aspartyl-tRNA(Asn)/glutamyl-tRNA(Gln) amidotransferase subunit A n=1 Tax=Motilibacter peucedani TaxID=598650 RepID=A0A420XS85_9ACTN|nr:amidase [Motilibacter peucedani]RKS77690.1 amidase/aspartyl-tRNA(Asn)/glutamyl-tRNA(Gln) amidotransferase subunit A [Motilibacter peucedani]
MRDTPLDDTAAPLDKGMARRSFLARTLAVSAAAAAGGATLAPGQALAATGEKHSDPKPAPTPTFSPEAWVKPRAAAVADITELTVAEAAYQIRSGAVKPAELAAAYLARIAELDGTYKAYNAVRSSAVAAEAKAAGRGDGRSPLHGVPLCIKDNYFTKGTETTANSTIFEGFVPDYDATAVARLKAVGALVIGKGQMGPLATTRATKPNGEVTTVNAWTPTDPSYDPGGSSSGPATSTAARLAASSIGTQTGGSIILPSAQQGLTGLKPTMGRVSIHGVIPLSFTRDHSGPLARTAMDAAIMLTAMAGADPADPRTLGLPKPADYVKAAAPVVTGGKPSIRWRTKIGVPPGYVSGPQAAQRKAYLDTLESIHKVDLVDVALPDEWALLTGAFNAVRLPERTEPFLPFLREDVRLFGVSLGSWIQGLFLSGDEFITGQRAKAELLDRVYATFFEHCDVVLQTDVVPFDILGLPEITMPIGFTTSPNGATVPVGAILGASAYAEDRLLAVAAAYQQVTDWHLRRPADPPKAAAHRLSLSAPLRLSFEEATAQTA